MDKTTTGPLRAIWLTLRALILVAVAMLVFSQPDGQIARATGNAMLLAAGNLHTCALSTTGILKCWGGNGFGQLGDGSITDHAVPVVVTGLASGVVAVAAGGTHTCALTNTGGVKCWGSNYSGQLGDGTTTNRSTPVAVLGLTSGVAALAAGGTHTCALTNTGGVKCWGSNFYGQLGDDTTTDRTTPVAAVGLTSGVTTVAAGSAHTCAVTAVGGVKCWGNNLSGELGDGTSTTRATWVDVIGLTSGASAVAAGHSHTCALTAASGVKCWGRNVFGQLGDSTTTDRSSPTAVTGLGSGVAAVAASLFHTCALTTAGGVKCWGYRGTGGGVVRGDAIAPGNVTGLTSGVVEVSAGFNHTCARTASGGVQCWGYNGDGQLGDGTRFDRATPVNVFGLTSGVAAVAAGYSHACVLTATGGIECWGLNVYGQLGDGTTTLRMTPVAVTGLTNGRAVSAGDNHTCALTVPYDSTGTIGGVKCWGLNGNGQLGDGSTTDRATVVDVVGLASGATAVAAGESHTCALTAASGVKCWGLNVYGQLGDGTTVDRASPADVTSLTSGIAAVAVGWRHACALSVAGGVKCWGYNGSGALGDGTSDQRTTPVDVTGLPSGVVAVALGNSHSCVLTSVGGVRCWGLNGNGQLGDGSTTDRSTPVDVPGLTSGVSALAAGSYHTCAVTAVGGIKCWGNNLSGELGDGTTTRRTTPVDVSGLNNGVASVAPGHSHTCVLTAAGGVKCWGYNAYGQLGDSTIVDRITPGSVVGISAPPGTLPVVTFSVHPIRGAAGFALGSQPVLALKDSSGVLRSGDNTTSATLGILPGTGAPSATVTCAPPAATAVSGAVTFAGCTIDRPGFGYMLRASASDGEAIGLTAPFNVTLAGDTNGDCRVSIVDFSLVVSSFGKTSASPDWTDPAKLAFRADLNGDNRVTILDFSIVVSRFGATATSCAPATN